jgi:hypothetical protein
VVVQHEAHHAPHVCTGTGHRGSADHQRSLQVLQAQLAAKLCAQRSSSCAATTQLAATPPGQQPHTNLPQTRRAHGRGRCSSRPAARRPAAPASAGARRGGGGTARWTGRAPGR